MDNRRRRLVGLALVGMVALGGCSTDTAVQVQPSVLVTDDGPLVRQLEAPSVLVDIDDPERLYLGAVDLVTGACYFSMSTDGGATWEEQAAPELAPFTDCGFGGADPKNVRTELEQGPDGTLYFVFHAHDPSAGGTRSVLLGRSSDGGRSWETSVVTSPGRALPGTDIEVNFVPHVAVDPADGNRVIVMWRRSFQTADENANRPSRPWMAVSDDGGATFREPFMMLEKDIGFDAPRPVIVEDRIFAFYRVRPQAEDADNLVVAGVSDDGGRTWEETEIAAAGDVSEPVPVYDRDSEVFHLVWHDNGNGELDAFYANSPDGRTWSEPIRLNDDPAGNRIGQFYPTISLAGDGRIDVAWYDYRDDPYPAPIADEGETLNLFNNMGKHQSVYSTSSDDGGETWTPNIRVNDVRIDRTIGPWNLNFFAQVPPSVSSAPDGPVVAWSDTRLGDSLTGTQDIAVAVVDLDDEELERSSVAALAGLAGLLLGAGLAVLGAALVLRRRPADAKPDS